jgi:hypothetical protein
VRSSVGSSGSRFGRRQLRPGEAQQQPPLIDPVRDRQPVGWRQRRRVGQDQHGRQALQQDIQVTRPDFGEGLQRAADIERAAQQLVGLLALGRRHDRDRPAPPALVQQDAAADAARARQIDPRHRVPHLARQIETNGGQRLALREGPAGLSQNASVLAARDQRGGQRRRGRGAANL